MFEIVAHEKIGDELRGFSADIRGRMFRLIERLQLEGETMRLPHSRVISGGLFELRVGGKDITRCLYAFAMGKKIYLLHAFVKKTQQTPAAAISTARQRLRELKNG
ncbi:MAG: type II toxin-antitoxin system RelE/ParE family toxin (plasmid) [Candidatus Symbiodolus clandestinus]